MQLSENLEGYRQVQPRVIQVKSFREGLGGKEGRERRGGVEYYFVRSVGAAQDIRATNCAGLEIWDKACKLRYMRARYRR